MTPRPIVPNPSRPAPTQPPPGTPSPMDPGQRPPTRPRIGAVALLATPPRPAPQPKPSDPVHGPDRPWPGMPPPSFAMTRPYPADDDPTVPGPKPPTKVAMTHPTSEPSVPTPLPRPTPFRAYLASLAVVAVATPAFVLVPYLLDMRVIAALFFAAAVAAFPKSASPSAPRSRGAVLAVHSLRRRLVVRAGSSLARPPVRA